MFLEVIKKHRLPQKPGILFGIVLRDENGERFHPAQPAAQADELGELITAQLVHAPLHVGKHPVPLLPDARPVAALRVVDNAATAPERGSFDSERARLLEDGAAKILCLGRVFRFDGDESFRNDSAQQERVLRLIAGRSPMREFRPLHRAPVGMSKSVERLEDLARDRQQNAADNRRLRRQFPGLLLR